MPHEDTSTGNYPRCTATRRDGEPCQARALPNRPFCWAHDPELATKRRRARAQGGANRSNVVRIKRVMPARLLPVFARLECAMEEVHDGALDPKRATAMASIARALVAVLTAGEMEERLRRIEEQVAERGEVRVLK